MKKRMIAFSDKPDETEIFEYKVFEAQAAAWCAAIVQIYGGKIIITHIIDENK